MSELKPCPFCGGEAEIKTLVYQSRFEEKTKQVECMECKATSSAGEHQGDLRNDEMAAREWNQRQDGWISVDDNPPTEAGRYIVYANDIVNGFIDCAEAYICPEYGNLIWSNTHNGNDYAPIITHYKSSLGPTTSTPPTPST